MKVARGGRAALTGVVVRPMRRRHLRRVLDIESRVYPRPWSASLFADELSRGDSRRYLVAVAPAGALGSRAVVGYAGLLLQHGERGLEAHVTTVAVDPRQHRRKIATHLVLGLLRAARDAGAVDATLEVRAANRGAQRLYGAFGFSSVAVRPGYYRETGEDAVIMTLRDLRSGEAESRLRAQEARLSAPGGSSGAPDEPVPWVRGRFGLDQWGS